ncbi:hypothetical protein [Pseudomonas baetica]|uniref:hypothetical protein n=1 Tax=Pseudomonas baetica TaxID=674054 RepID=UPI002405EB47|nr:hypothetical protein [Pseudomonas baetica]MDF9779107.1 hypothetical protein [Pseudomonas baetica]
MNNSNVSAGVSFLQAAANGIAKSIGERLRSATMNDLLLTAIKTKMAFMPDDAASLQRFSIMSSVGVFRPLDEAFYRQACLYGGSYAQMWEKSHGVKPMKAARAGTSNRDVQTDIRVAADIAVFLVGEDDDPLMPRYEGLQVWWVTSINLEGGTINLGRYKLYADERYPFNRFDAPAKRKKLNREQWDEAQQLVRSTLLSAKSAA